MLTFASLFDDGKSDQEILKINYSYMDLRMKGKKHRLQPRFSNCYFWELEIVSLMEGEIIINLEKVLYSFYL